MFFSSHATDVLIAVAIYIVAGTAFCGMQKYIPHSATKTPKYIGVCINVLMYQKYIAIYNIGGK